MPLTPELTEFTTSQQAVASYNYTDIDAGIGLQTFYPIVGKISTGNTYSLTTSAFDGWFVESNTSETLTFQSGDFNLPRRVKGTAILSAHLYKESATTYITAKLQKWDGTTATDLTDTIQSSQPGTTTSAAVFFQMPITNEETIGDGDSLRLVIVFTAGANSALGFSPTNQPSTGGNLSNTTMVLAVPFALDI